MGLFRDYARQTYNDLKASMARSIRQREAIRVLSVMHAQELATTPGNEWVLTKQKHAAEIRAVRDGKFDIVDRRSWAFPYLPESLHRLNQPLIKNVPYNLRRFAETPIPRRAINLIKNAVLSLAWKVMPMDDSEDTDPEVELRIKTAMECLKHPSNDESWRTLIEAVLEDLITIGCGVMEPGMTPSPRRPFKLWAVDGNTIRRFLDWTESDPDKPKYAQMTGLKGERGMVAFRADELVYIRQNVRTSTPFPLGQLEVAFNAVNWLLGSQDAAGKAAADVVHKTWLFWEQTQNPAHLNTIRRHITNELEGQAKISLMMGMKKPEQIEVLATKPDDLLIPWQEFLIRIIACAFDLSPMALGLERDVNRNTATVMALSDWKSGVVPVARRIEEAITRDILHKFMGWKDLKFSFLNLEDPDMSTTIMLMQRVYAMNAITPNQICEKLAMPPVVGGWGDMTQLQSMIFAEAAAAKIQDAAAQDQTSEQMSMLPPAPPYSAPGQPQNDPRGAPQGPGAYQPLGGGGPGSSGKGPQASPSVNKLTGLQPVKGPKLASLPGTQAIPSAPRGTTGGSKFTAASDGSIQKKAKKKPGKFGSAGQQTIPGGKFSAKDIANMDPDEVKDHQDKGNLPSNKQDISDEMEKQLPGIMQQLNEMLKDFLEDLPDNEDEDKDEVADVSPKMEKDQKKKFNESVHDDTEMEKLLNRRGYTQSVAGPGSQSAKKAFKGLKYIKPGVPK